MKEKNANLRVKKRGWQAILAIGSVPKKSILLFTKSLFIMLKAGVTLSEALVIFKDQFKGKFHYVLQDVYNQVEKGYKLSEALTHYKKIFSEIYINIVRVGEESGNLENNLEHLAEQLEKSQSLRRKIISAAIYPAVILSGGIALTIAIVIFILPKITLLFVDLGVNLPPTTKILIFISNFFQSQALLKIIISVVIIIILIWLAKLRFVQPLTHWLILHLPIIKKVSLHRNLTVFSRNLNILLKSGIPIDRGLDICTNILPNYHYRQFIKYAYTRVKAGDNLTSAMKQNPKLFPLVNTQIIQVGEVSGSLSRSLDYCCLMNESEVDNLVKNLSSILEPILLVLMALFVGFLALSIITPIYTITSSLSS